MRLRFFVIIGVLPLAKLKESSDLDPRTPTCVRSVIPVSKSTSSSDSLRDLVRQSSSLVSVKAWASVHTTSTGCCEPTNASSCQGPDSVELATSSAQLSFLAIPYLVVVVLPID